MTMAAAEFEPADGARVALAGVTVDATLHGLLSHVTMTQTYRNLEARSIEAVYTFPLPLEAVLLGLELEINGQRLDGRVMPREDAEETYEDAIEAGDTAVSLRRVERCVYSVSIGNIMPGEQAMIRYRYSQLHRWQGDTLGFRLPTTIAPRYGDPSAAGYALHEIPEASLNVDHGFTLSLTIVGALARADLHCPTHPIGVRDRDDSRTVHLAGGTALMDRDLVLNLHRREGVAHQGLWALDGEGVVALASFNPPTLNSSTPNSSSLQPPASGIPVDSPPRTVKLVVDCSGSMGGDAIRQARVAVSAILDSLRPVDRFNLTTFGSTHRLLFAAPRPADDHHLGIARRFVGEMNASLGGTEIGPALAATYRATLPGTEAAADVLLVTDGEIWEQDDILAAARASGHRIFTVGVGSAVSEGFVQAIATDTGGACELVSPGDEMASRIVRHFERLHAPRAALVDIAWPGTVRSQAPAVPNAVFAGDTLHVFAQLDGTTPAGPVVLTLQYDDGQRVRCEAKLDAASTVEQRNTLPRLAAHTRIEEMNTADGIYLARDAVTALAVDYQLLTGDTRYVVVHARAEGEKANGMPELRRVPQMLAAGWGGTGMQRSRVASPTPYAPFTQSTPSAPAAPAAPAAPSRAPARREAAPSSARFQARSPTDVDYLDIPAFLRRHVESPETSGPASIETLEDLPFATRETLKMHGIDTIEALVALTRENLLALDGIDAADVAAIEAALSGREMRLAGVGEAELA